MWRKGQKEVTKVLEGRIKSILYSGSQVETMFQEGGKHHVKCSGVNYVRSKCFPLDLAMLGSLRNLRRQFL